MQELQEPPTWREDEERPKEVRVIERVWGFGKEWDSTEHKKGTTKSSHDRGLFLLSICSTEGGGCVCRLRTVKYPRSGVYIRVTSCF